MKRLSAALAVLAIAGLLSVPPAAAATKIIKATAFRTMLNYDPADVQILQFSSGFFIVGSAFPDMDVGFWAPVRLPVGARITRVRY